MITVENLSRENIIAVGGEDFKLAMRGNSGYGQWQYGYELAQDDESHLYYVALSGSVKLKSDASVTGNGFLIAENVEDKPYVLGLAFYPFKGSYEDASDSYKQEVVNAYNATLGGDIIETTDDVVIAPILNEQGETYAEEKARIDAEKIAQEDDLSAQGKSIYEEIIIREWDETLVYENGSTLSGHYRIELIQITSGTSKNPTVEYRVEEINTGSSIESTRIKSTVTVQTQEEAETIFDNIQSGIENTFQAQGDESAARILASQTVTTSYEDIEVFFQESPLSFEEMMTVSGYEYGETAFRNSRANEVGGERNGGLKTGPFEDAATWNSGGNTLELDDFDSPRITTEGVMANPSGAIGFTIIKGWKVTFNMKIDDGASFINAAAKNNDGVTVDGNDFDFIMYGGDRLEIDIDNERDNLHPFYITTQGRTWISEEEIDDEVELTMVKAERLYFTAVTGERETFVQSGDIKSDTITVDLAGPVNFSYGPLSESENLIINSKVNAKVQSDPQFVESLTYTRNLEIGEVATEDMWGGLETAGGAILDAPSDLVDAAGDAVDYVGDKASEAAGAVWDSIKWWLLGGIVAIVAVGLLVVYVNGRSRRTQVVQAAPISEA